MLCSACFYTAHRCLSRRNRHSNESLSVSPSFMYKERGFFMSLKLFEVAGTHIFSMSAIVMVLFFVFAIIVVGYLLGKINIKGVSL